MGVQVLLALFEQSAVGVLVPHLRKLGSAPFSSPEAPRLRAARKVKELTMGALQEIVATPMENGVSLPEVSGTTAQKRRSRLDYIARSDFHHRNNRPPTTTPNAYARMKPAFPQSNCRTQIIASESVASPRRAQVRFWECTAKRRELGFRWLNHARVWLEVYSSDA